MLQHPLKCAATPVRLAVLGLLRVYKLAISPFLGRRCRFEPSCSCYAQQAVVRFGVVRGGILAMMRLGRCGPFHPGGYDPVPDKFTLKACLGHAHGQKDSLKT